MNEATRCLLLFFILSMTLAFFLPNTAYASPGLSVPYYSKPTNHIITGTKISVTNPTYAYDLDTGTFTKFDYDPDEAGAYEVISFTTPATTNPIAFADFKLIYKADAGGTGPDEEYRILYDIYHTDYYDADSCVLADFSGTGSSPYVDAEDHPTNYISGSTAIVVVVDESVGLGDGKTVIFYLDNKPVVSGSETIYLNDTATTDYTINYAEGKITFTTAPPSFMRITADYSYYRKSVSGDIGFADMPSLGGVSLHEVILDVDCWSDYGSPTTGKVLVWDVSQSKYVAYTLPFPGSKPADGVYQTFDLSSMITTSGEVNALKITIRTAADISATFIVDHCRLKVTTKSNPVVLQGWTGSAVDYSTSPRVWSNQPEPYDGVWDWTDIGGIHLRVETVTGGGGASYFYEYEAWVSVYHYRKPTVFVDPASQTDPSSPFTINIKISTVDDLYGWEFKLYYNKTILTISTVTLGPLLNDTVGTANTWGIIKDKTDAYNATHGRVWAAQTILGDYTGATVDTGTLATLTFTVDGPAGTTPLSLKDTKLVGYEFTNKRLAFMTHDTTDGTVTITVVVPEFPAGLALEIALIVVIIYVWQRRRRKEPKKLFSSTSRLPKQTK